MFSLRPKKMELGKITVCMNKGQVMSRSSWKMMCGYNKVSVALCQILSGWSCVGLLSSGLGCCSLQGPKGWSDPNISGSSIGLHMGIGL